MVGKSRVTMEHNNIHPSGDIGISGISGIYGCFSYFKYPLHLSIIYIYLYFLGKKKDIFNSNLIIILIIVSNYKFINISYYTYLIFNLKYL